MRWYSASREASRYVCIMTLARCRLWRCGHVAVADDICEVIYSCGCFVRHNNLRSEMRVCFTRTLGTAVVWCTYVMPSLPLNSLGFVGTVVQQ
jgi:hypothetical protein